MSRERIQAIGQKVQSLRKLDQKLTVFGASSHRYRLTPTSKTEHEALSQRGWPETYLLFLHLVGSGAGPYYGLLRPQHSLEDAKHVWLLDQPIDDSGVNQDAEVIRLMIDAGATKNTLIPICDYGCGERFMLAVAGPRKDSLWYDYGFDDNSVRPLERSFLDFYESWVDHALKQQEQP